MATRNGSKLIQAITKSSQRVVSTTVTSPPSAKVIAIDEVTETSVGHVLY